MTALERPRSLSELFSLRRAGVTFVAGGTDWIIRNRGRLSDDAVVADLSLIDEMRGISLDGGYLRIGALETMTSLHGSALVRKYASALADAAYVMGSEQIRNRATVGGNVANSSPAADTPPALAALGAEAVVASAEGKRRVPVEEIVGRNKNNLAEGELIKEFIIPADAERISAFLKVGSRSQVSISRINVAAAARPQGGLYKEGRLFVGTLGVAARRCTAAEAAMGAPGLEKSLPEALCALAAEAIPGRPTLPYKQSALRALAQDLCAKLAERRAADE
ncbi:FAD binding domain-containing protein [Synergistes jonesii]|uniref:FAD binding domain-containing protein n=1 Tax=Synergistes jonesii TaxID=2754 RepID=UPI00248DEA1A|nr:FAD binding domain-containing protein [Synergistes jonesii]